MRISWNWLRQYITTDLSPQQAADILTSTGLETESVEVYEPVKGMLAGVVVGHVLECAKHPDADRLSVCSVDLGSGGPVQIVCGASNVAKGQKVLVATVGTTIHLSDGTHFVIKKSKIRGQESHGMICAEDELGLGQSHAGIMVLDPAAPTGKPASDHLELQGDHVLEIGLTPNRTDAMGHFGVARDLRAALAYRTGAQMQLKLPSIEAFAQDETGDAVRVEVRDTFACPHYAGVLLTGIHVGPSPDRLQQRLKAIGLKPINNVVDVTNYVQHEMGQPLHAFDVSALRGRRIVVRMATADEAFTTLDGKERKLDPQDLVIADAERPVCIAGVFGGSESGVTESTTTVFLESAYFEPGTIRRTARRHGLSTDASFRFERGVDPELTLNALKRAALLLKEFAGARIASDIADVDHSIRHTRVVKFTFEALERLTGVTIGSDAVVSILELLDFRILHRTSKGLEVEVPAYRVDVHRPADVFEEVLRIHGYDEVPLPERLLCPPVLHDALTLESMRTRTAAHFATRGLREIMTPSLVNGTRTLSSNAATADQLVGLLNPLSAELDVLRPTMLFGMLHSVAHNVNRQQRDLAFFERGRTYRRKGDKTIETETFGLVLTGRRFAENWRSASRKAELLDAKEELETLLKSMDLHALSTWEPMEHALLANAHALLIKGRRSGVVGEVKKPVLRSADVSQPVFFAEVDEQALLEACLQQNVSFTDIPKFPMVRRDLSLLLDGAVHFTMLKKLAFDAERKLLREVDLFDVYQGDKLPAGKKSYALSFHFQDAEKTLTDEQVEKAMGRIRHALEHGAGAEVRA